RSSKRRSPRQRPRHVRRTSLVLVHLHPVRQRQHACPHRSRRHLHLPHRPRSPRPHPAQQASKFEQGRLRVFPRRPPRRHARFELVPRHGRRKAHEFPSPRGSLRGCRHLPPWLGKCRLQRCTQALHRHLQFVLFRPRRRLSR